MQQKQSLLLQMIISSPNLDETIIHDQRKYLRFLIAKKGQRNKIERNGKKRKKWSVILVSILLSLIILGILTVTVFPALVVSKDIKVPDVSVGRN